MKSLLFFAALCVALTGCQPGEDRGTAGPPCGDGRNLLENSGFDAAGEYALVPWTTAQHAGEPSFELSIAGGVVEIRRIGTQPWFVLSQDVPVDSLVGSQLEFRAELRLDLDAEGWAHAMDPGGGLNVLVWAAPARIMARNRLVYSSAFEHEPSLGSTEWFTASVRFAVPDNAARMRVGFVHRANGSMAIRNPGLHDCGPSPVEEATVGEEG